MSLEHLDGHPHLLAPARLDPKGPPGLTGGPEEPIGPRLLGATFAALLRWQHRTWRLQAEDLERFDRARQGERVLVAFWHGKYFPLFSLLQGRQALIFSNDSFRGRVIREIAARFGQRCVCLPSGDREGTLAQMRSAMTSADLCAAAVDGPVGPARRVKPGIVRLAAEQRYKLLPVTVCSTWKRVSRGRWDRRETPCPFSRVRMRVGEPLELPGELTRDEELGLWCRRLEERLEDLEAR